ncbi:hypothetical protein EMA8858_01841 [Emticicia aquatica]|jgi:hypothetical protein|uniref:DUF4249 family protein n=1 Tax=Emticicia aquatica TaxID=1681835 RepID=A0ABN8ES27_9BACT|nr:DUF4249 domain-containing protein [Emticicia aquatica]CAH0995716.1 hypothetical protein EMA8858_01841 [Emticicia aquatica]
MKKIYLLAILLAFQVFLMGCTETNTVINPGEKPIIEAYLAPNHRVSMKVYTEIPYTETSEGTSVNIDGLSIKISGSNGKVFNLKSVGNGVYESAENELVGAAKTTYTLEFDYKGRKVAASTEIPAKPINFKIDKTEISRTQIDLSSGTFPPMGGGGGPFGGGGETNTSVELTWDNPENIYHFVAVENTETSPIRILIPPSGATFPNFRFTNEPLTGSSNILRSQSFEYFGNHDVILYRVNAEYAALYQSSGTTSQNLSTPPTSIINGLGIFTGINADTLKFLVKKN